MADEIAPLKMDEDEYTELKRLETAAAGPQTAYQTYKSAIYIKYGIGPLDTISEDGTITRGVVNTPTPGGFGPGGPRGRMRNNN